jgi:hypothetical protein
MKSGLHLFAQMCRGQIFRASLGAIRFLSPIFRRHSLSFDIATDILVFPEKRDLAKRRRNMRNMKRQKRAQGH